MIDVLTPGINGRRFLAYILQSMYSKRCDSPLQPCVAGKSDLEVSEVLRRPKLAQNKSDPDNNLCVSSSQGSWGVNQIIAHELAVCIFKNFG